MCIYIQTIPLCGHRPPTIFSYASCTNVLSQLMRITEPEAWEPGSIGSVPFEMSDECDPRPGNTYVLYSDDYCGWECRNNACLLAAELGGLVGGGDEGLGGVGGGGGGGLLPAYDAGRGQYVMGGGAAGGLFGGPGAGSRSMVMGMPGAKYGPGSERLGIGWRTAC